MTHCMRHQHHIGPGCKGTFGLALAGLNLALLLVGASTASAQTASAPPSASASAPSPTADETPRVLYVVPWKQPLPGVPTGRPLNSVLDEVPGFIDRAVFWRQIGYSQQVQRVTGSLQSSTLPPVPVATSPSPSTARSNTTSASTPATR